MYLTKLTISGFKSFAKKGELSFESPITAIVGPNGSGKSNVAEAFRFVLGEQSVKSMRGKRGEDLIWGGSEAAARAQRGAVSITLNNSSRVFSLDYDEITIERVVHRDGQNEYSINGSKVRLKDVQELLAAANIGPSGHHIISQGEADRILSAGTKERREMIEDALGLKVFQYKKQDAERKLSKTTENIAEVQTLRREVAPQLTYLEKQVKRIEKATQLKEELKHSYADYLKREDHYLAAEDQRLQHARTKPEKRLTEVQRELEAAKTKLAQESEHTNAEQIKDVQSRLADVRSQRQTLLREVGSREGQVGYVERRLQAQHASSPETAPATDIPRDSVAEVVFAIEQEVTKAQKSDDSKLLSRTLANILHKLKLLLQEARRPSAPDTSADEAELTKLKNELQEKQTKLTAVQTAETELHGTLTALEQEVEANAAQGRETERTVFTLTNEQRELELTLEHIAHEAQVLERDRADFKREIQEAVALIGSAANQYLHHSLTHENGQEIDEETITLEDRTVQRERRQALEKLKIRLEETGVEETDETLAEYQQTKERDEFLAHEIADLEASVEKLTTLIEDLNEQLNAQFNAGLEKISAEFNRFFTLMFGGGEAALVRLSARGTQAGAKAKVKSDDDSEENADENDAATPEEGIELAVKLPNKRVRGLEMLSGGERALTSIALIFAMSQVNPPLFVILDETDAALDEANSRRYGDMIEALAEKSQLVLITHNRETMSRAGILYGVTMGADGISKLLSVKFDEAVQVAK